MMLTPCPDSFSKTLGTKEYLRTFDAGYTSFGPREYFSFASPWCLACWNSWKAWVLVIKCSRVPKVTLQWKSKCYYLSELSIQLFIFPRNLNSYLQTYSWWRRSSSAQWQLTQSLRRPGPPVLPFSKFGSTWTPAEHFVNLQVKGKSIMPGPVGTKIQDDSWARTGIRDHSSIMVISSERHGILVISC